MEPTTQPNHTVTDVDSAADDLRKVAADIQDFMGKWVVRSRRVIGHGSDPMEGDVSLSVHMQKFEENQRKWETRRQREMDEIAEKAEELSAAWLKLESEQRQFLQMKESWQHRINQSRNVEAADQPESDVACVEPQSCPPAIPSDQSLPPVAGPPRMPQSAPQVAPRLPVNHTYTAMPAVGADARDAAIRQFEQLRREVAAKHS